MRKLHLLIESAEIEKLYINLQNLEVNIMANERKTEQMARSHFEQDKDFIRMEEQKSDKLRIAA
ncbi:MAG: hypothetical protein LBK94_07760 [Prevotellaceae bacterium]|jgi:hypothetical protein|nr:hypothetical protein [Prevotellaceae bacterium]